MTAVPPDMEANLRQENARLLAELRASGERQAASAEILRAIASTPGDAERSLQQIAETTARLFGAPSVSLYIADGEQWVRTIRVGASSKLISSQVSPEQTRIGGGNLPGTVVQENRQIHIPDLDAIDPAMADWPGLPHARAAGTRTMCGTPLRRGGKAFGVLIVHRDRPEPFTAEELALQQSFADQAVIAIENARLFNETQEALARQRATSEILRVISQSPTDVQPVFDAIVLTATRLFRRDLAFILGCDATTYWPLATARPEGLLATPQLASVAIDPDANFPSRVIVTGKNLHLPDWSAVELPEYERMVHETLGLNSALYLPLLREGKCVGVLGIAGKRAGIFGESEISLAESFRDQALIAIKNVRQFNETREALERQTATAEILKVIASSPSDVQPVFEAIAASANRLLEGLSTAVYSLVDDAMQLSAFTRTSPAADAALTASSPLLLSAHAWGDQIRNGEIVRILDIEIEWAEHPALREVARLRGFRSLLLVPLLRDREPIGMINVARVEPGTFADHHVQLLQTFADQAVIAIENARLFNETKEALERQTATAEILKVIASSPSDVQPVFEAIATSANRLIGGFSTTVFRFIDGAQHLMAFTPTNAAADEALKASFPLPVARFPPFELVRDGAVVQFADTEAESGVPRVNRDIARLRGYRSMVFTPLMSNGASIGMISVTRKEPGTFAAHHVQLLQTFADQAVIAIENVRLFDEVQARTEDLRESLQQQTATADVLKVISRSVFDLQTVLDTLVESAYKLCGASVGLLYLRGDEAFECKAIAGVGVAEATQLFKGRPIRAGRGTAAERVILTGEVQSVTDFLEDPDFDPKLREFFRNTAGSESSINRIRSTLAVPMTRDGVVIGVVVIARPQTGPFPARQIELLQSFADQAVIAIENVRLFDEVQARTEDLRESLQQQTATADVLKVISRSAFDLQTVLDTLVESAARLCDADRACVFQKSGEVYRWVSNYGFSEELIAYADAHPFTAGPHSTTSRVALEGKPIHNPDVLADPNYKASEHQRLGNYRTMLGIPLLREGAPIGVFILAREQVRPFTDRQIELVTSFADQAVIAIENARLFDEVRARTEDLRESLQQQTATADVLKVISRSAFDLQTVFDTLISSAIELSGAVSGTICVRDGDVFPYRATVGTSPEFAQFLAEHPAIPGRHSTAGRVILSGEVVCIPDVMKDSEYRVPVVSFQIPTGSCLGVPLLRNDKVEGALVLVRAEPGDFDQRQIELVKTFTDQAVIAIENVRLFDEVQARTEDLRESLQQQTATAEVLKVISRSTFDLQAVLDTLIQSAAQLCDAHSAHVYLREGETYKLAACTGFSQQYEEFLKQRAIAPGRGTLVGRTAQEGRIVSIPDILLDREYDYHAAQKLGGFRTMLGIPMLRDGVPIGVLGMTRSEVRAFTDKQIDLVSTFADQAVIAIENVRLFEQVQARTRQLSASLDELRTAQDRLVQTEKLASLGQLTAGIAHEIKNPLNFVNNFAALSAELTDELNELLAPAALDAETREEVDEITHTLKGNLEKVVQHGKRADSIVKNMLLHSREGSGEHRPADINALLDESLNLAYHGARAEKREFNVTLHRDFDDMAGQIEVFPQEITRVFLNLISNGFYAVTKRKTENADFGFEPALSAATKNLGDTVEIRIRDNGVGIPAEVREKMFNPFFTTKPAGEGTGLGLSMSHDIIVKQHGGSIDVTTEPGHFTEFRIVLPRTSNSSSKIRG